MLAARWLCKLFGHEWVVVGIQRVCARCDKTQTKYHIVLPASQSQQGPITVHVMGRDSWEWLDDEVPA